MAKKKSSFHMGDEFNGSGKKPYLWATQHNTYAPLSQHNVRLTPKFNKFVPAVIGALPVGVETTLEENNDIIKVTGSIANVEKVTIKKNSKGKGYKTKFGIRKIQLTTGAYPIYKKISQPKTEKDILEEILPEEEELEWIPTNILQIDGITDQDLRCNFWLEDHINGNVTDPALKWDQDKVEKVWEKCRSYYEDYGIQVDSRLLIAIVAKESTGSFNTSSENIAADGGNGVESNFDEDCKKAIDLLGGKIIAYTQFHKDFSAAREETFSSQLSNIRDYDDVLHYLNWKTPRLSFLSNRFYSGVYAADNNWNTGIRQIYSELAYDGVTEKYTNYIQSLDENTLINLARRKGISVTTDVEFFAIQNGKNDRGVDNGQYTIVGEVP